jgi:hypothetical protein
MPDQNNLLPITIRTVVDVTDPDYFCNKSWTLSFNMNTKSWISFHTYIPNFYIGENNFFYSGLNGGCDLEAIAGEEVPFVPTTSSSTTKCLTCKPAPSTTTTTTTLDCNISGQTISLECNLAGSAIDITPPVTTSTTSSTTTFNCTTSTTTTVCPSCSTYTISNPTQDTLLLSYTSCVGGEAIQVNVDPGPVDLSFQICSCVEPTAEEGLVVTLVDLGCITCFCYEITNTTLCEIYLQYTNCDGDVVNPNLPALTTVNICVKNGELQVGDGGIVSGGSTPCTSNDDCTTTTTTTAI